MYVAVYYTAHEIVREAHQNIAKMPQYTLYYFNARCRAELSRMIFKVAGVNFEDKRLTYEEWTKLKPDSPFGQMPFLEVDGKRIAQSTAIARYLANEFGLAGENNFERAKVDEAVEFVSDLLTDVVKLLLYPKEGEKEESRKEFVSKYKTYEENFEKIFKRNEEKSGFLVGRKLTYADLFLFSVCDYLKDVVTIGDTLKAHQKKIGENRVIAEWLRTRPVTEM